jgi:Asp-tRNA(Asn)/Glu-tRNA(Gln) amidotransferase A subunit family amidase
LALTKRCAALLSEPHCLPAAATGSCSSLTATTPIANSIADAMLLYASMANTSYARAAAASRKLSLPKELLTLQARNAANADWVLGSEQPLQNIKIGLCRKVRVLAVAG